MPQKKKPLHHPHDSIFRKALSDVKVGCDLLRQHLPQALQALIDWDSVRPDNTAYIHDDLKTSASDILYQLNTKGGQQGYLYILCEHQNRPEKYMVLRLWEYTLNIFRNHLKKGYRTLPLVIPLVIYNGKQLYPKDYPRDIMALFESPELAKQWMFQPFQLIDLSTLEDDTLMQTPWAGLLQMVMKHIHDQDIEPTFRTLLKAHIPQTLLDQKAQDYLKTMLYYVYNTADISDKEHLVQLMDQADSTLGALNMTIAEQWRQEGRQLGRKEGMRRGEKKSKYDMARAMLRANEPIKKIEAYTGLSIAELKELRQKLHD